MCLVIVFIFTIIVFLWRMYCFSSRSSVDTKTMWVSKKTWIFWRIFFADPVLKSPISMLWMSIKWMWIIQTSWRRVMMIMSIIVQMIRMIYARLSTKSHILTPQRRTRTIVTSTVKYSLSITMLVCIDSFFRSTLYICSLIKYTLTIKIVNRIDDIFNRFYAGLQYLCCR